MIFYLKIWVLNKISRNFWGILMMYTIRRHANCGSKAEFKKIIKQRRKEIVFVNTKDIIFHQSTCLTFQLIYPRSNNNASININFKNYQY